VLDLARKCDWHRTHSEQVARLCLRLFDETRAIHNMGNAERELIEYGALLHDIGWHISRNDHHKHAMYLILNGDLKNFTPEETAVIANIARYHRGPAPKKRHEKYAELPKRLRRIVNVGSALLRLADGLDRSHGGVIQDLRCKVDDKSIKCLLTARADAELEVWGARRKMDWFTDVFDRNINFEVIRK
jgi:exopolyphosphatase/guanosine-5'-triphosphate,3'-diphosphate pyrophosphatase